MIRMNPFAQSIVPATRTRQPLNFGLGSLFDALRKQQEAQQNASTNQAVAEPPVMQRQQPVSPFADIAEFQALQEYQQSLAPTEDERTKLQELQQAFQGTGAFKDFRIQQLENQMQQRRPMMGMGLGMARPAGMGMFGGFPMRQPMQQPMRRFGAFGFNQPQPMQQPNFYSGYGGGMRFQQMPMQRQPQYGGYNQFQQMGSGYGGYGGMPNMYQPQQMGVQNRGMNQFGGFGNQSPYMR